ncbi:hypothetical protein HOE04_04225 [archaeon]|jgi:uncharacterized membrane protein (UPF0127 family)|nr:hypothetical protein [archaeon]
MVLETFTFTNKNKAHTLKIKPLTTPIQKTIGLMFKKNSPPLLFIFKKPTRQPIHSFFCKPFIAIWLNKENQIIEKKLIKPYQISIKPKQKFTKLLEIPQNNPNFQKIL